MMIGLQKQPHKKTLHVCKQDDGNIGSVRQVPQRRGDEKTGRHGTVLLVLSTTFGIGNAKITVLARTEPNRSRLLGGHEASQTEVNITCLREGWLDAVELPLCHRITTCYYSLIRQVKRTQKARRTRGVASQWVLVRLAAMVDDRVSQSIQMKLPIKPAEPANRGKFCLVKRRIQRYFKGRYVRVRERCHL